MESENSNAAAESSTAQRRPVAPYGQACVGCSKAKTRCVGRSPDVGCERCRRLGRECQPSAVVRKGRSRRRSPRPTRTAALERKLENLVTLLKSQNSANTSPEAASSGAHEEVGVPEAIIDAASTVAPSVVPSLWSDRLPGQIPAQSEASQPRRHLSPSDNLSRTRDVTGWYCTASTRDAEAALGRSPTEDEVALNTFRDFHLKFFPLMYIPPEVGPSQLRSTKPLTWLAIQAVACKSIPKKKELDIKFRTQFAQRYVVNLERSMDLLLGLMVYVSWLTMYNMGQRFLSSYSSMAASLVFDLRLDRIARWDPCKESDSMAAFGNPIKKPLPPVVRTNEERRASIACFCICATVSSFLRTPPMRWTPHMEDTLEHLAKEPEVFGDEALAAMARALKIGEDVLTASGWRFFELEAYSPPKPPPMVHVKALRSNLDVLRKSLRPELAENKIVRSYLSWTDAMVNELPLTHRPSSPSGPNWVDFGKAECFHACVEALRYFLNECFDFTPHEIFGMHIGIGLHYAQATHMVYRLAIAPDSEATHDDPGYDRASVRNAIDLPQTLERAAQAWGSMPREVGIESDGTDPFTMTGVILRSAAVSWKKALDDAEARSRGQVGTTAEVGAESDAGVPLPSGETGDAGIEDFPMEDFTAAAGFWMPDMFAIWDDI